jgi:hypothetical protein
MKLLSEYLWGQDFGIPNRGPYWGKTKRILRNRICSRYIGKRPILYRREGTKLHFDLAVHNCPEYKNVTELRERLRKRLTAIIRGE